MFHRMCTIVWLAIAACVFAGCQEAPYAPKQVADVEAKFPVLIMDKACQKAVAISKQRADWTADRRLIAEAVMVNKQKAPYRVQVQTTFKDADGFEVQSTNWELILLPASGFYSYKATAMNTKAENFNVRIRTAQ
ncbi:MAG: DUF1425 domain-containing protein [Phycisphaerae bacterium]|nr:DUF1425 domain-containing protein [Phycisphaerae bacterium]